MRLIDADALIEEYDRVHVGAPGGARKLMEDAPTIPEKLYTKADYIMALHKEYGCSFVVAEEAHNKALEYLRDNARMKG